VETEYYTAKRKAAKRLCRRGVKPGDLPSNAEIRDQIQIFARLHEGEKRTQHLKEMRLEALRLMRLLRAFRPRLIGSVMTGHVRKGSDIDLHLFTDGVGLVTTLLEQEGFQFEVERKQITKFNETRTFTHIHIFDHFNFELTVYPADKAHYVFNSEDFDDLMLLRQCDDAGRVPGAVVGTVDEALDFLKELERSNR
jgi:hypothetical protein